MLAIGILGKAESGKDTAADRILENLQSSFQGIRAVKRSFADPLKEAVAYLFGLTQDDMYTPLGKTRQSRWYGLTNREILQRFGTESMRDVFNDNVWLDIAEDQARQMGTEILVVPDVRFDNEASWVKEKGILLEVRRPGGNALTETERQHRSEADLSIEADFVIQNDGDLEGFLTVIDLMTGMTLAPLVKSYLEAKVGLAKAMTDEMRASMQAQGISGEVSVSNVMWANRGANY